MAKLVLSAGGSIIHQCFLDKERVTIGAKPENELVVDDPAVAPTHAAIVSIGNDHIFEDLQAGGTLVNGEKVSHRILQHGDVIQLGAHYVRYLNPRAVDAELERTMLIPAALFGKDRSPSFGTRPAVSPELHSDPAGRAPSAAPSLARGFAGRRAVAHFPKGHLNAIAGPRTGETIALDRVIAIFGRPGEGLAVLTRRPQGYFITHVEGRRRARVNGQSIGLDPRALRHGDVIEVADSKLQFALD